MRGRSLLVLIPQKYASSLSKHLFTVTLVCIALVALMHSPVTHALTIESPPGKVDVLNGISGSPARIEKRVVPGTTYHFALSFQNRFGSTAKLSFAASDLSSGSKGNDPDFVPVEQGIYGAGSWVTVDGTSAVLKHGYSAILDATVKVPKNVSPGSYYAAVTATGGGESVDGTGAVINTQVGIELFLTVPGDEDFAGRIESTQSPRFVQSTPGFDCLPGIECHSFLPIEIEYHNLGNQTDLVHGEVSLVALGGKTAARLKLDQLVLLRGSRRQFTTSWGDPPWIGRFTPKVELVSRSGKRVTTTLDPIWIMPAWYYWVVLLLAIGGPLGWRIRARKRWRAMQDEISELRENQRSDEEFDESDWDSE